MEIKQLKIEDFKKFPAGKIVYIAGLDEDGSRPIKCFFQKRNNCLIPIACDSSGVLTPEECNINGQFELDNIEDYGIEKDMIFNCPVNIKRNNEVYLVKNIRWIDE